MSEYNPTEAELADNLADEQREMERLRNECKTTQPDTLGYQRCWRPKNHKGKHESQDGKRY